MPSPRPILLIAGGVGGLPTLEAVAARCPGRTVHYVADTARGGFGHSSPAAAVHHVEQLLQHTSRLHPALVLLASHTLSAACLPALKARLPHLTIAGVIEPAARAAAQAAGATYKPTIGVLAGSTAINSRGFQAAIGRRRSRATVLLQPCPLLAPLVEEGRSPADKLLRTALKQYLKPMLDRAPDVILLGGGHLSKLAPAVQELAGDGCRVVDAVAATADDVARRLGPMPAGDAPAELACHVTDDADRFARIGKRLCDLDLPPADVIPLADLPILDLPDAGLRRAG